MNGFEAKILSHYHFGEEDRAFLFGAPSLSLIPSIDGDIAVEKAKARILSSIERHEKVIVYGDYDCDGIMATSILVYCFHRLGHALASYIPSRYQDGYGLNKENAVKIADAGYSLVILADNGVSCLNEIEYLSSRGIDTIVIDHHNLGEALPSCYALIHPKTLNYGSQDVSAGFLSSLFSRCLLGQNDPYLLELGALSLLSDLMPLKDHNRTAVRLLLQQVNDHLNQPFSLLLDHPSDPIDEKTLGMELIPCINAVGRLATGHEAQRLVHYFALDAKDKMGSIAAYMKQTNARRKELTIQAGEKLSIDDSLPGVCVLVDLPEGLNGLLANRLMKQTHKPCAVFSSSQSEPGCYVGSLRSEEGFSVVCFYEEAKPLLKKCGGHEKAGGLTIEKEDYPAFKELFLAYCKSHPFTKNEDLIPLELSECTVENYRILLSYGPFGMGYEEPTFLLRSLDSSRFGYTRDNKYLSTFLSPDVKLFSFELGKKDFVDGGNVDLKAKFVWNRYGNKENLDIRLSR